MKATLLLSALTFSLGTFAQGPNLLMIESFGRYDSLQPPSGPNEPNPYPDFIQQQEKEADPPAKQQQAASSVFSSNENNKAETKIKDCKDCEEVKKAVAASKTSSGMKNHRKTSALKKRARKIVYSIDRKMDRVFGRKYKVRTSYSVCFAW